VGSVRESPTSKMLCLGGWESLLSGEALRERNAGRAADADAAGAAAPLLMLAPCK
jgi:hypothetical protein